MLILFAVPGGTARAAPLPPPVIARLVLAGICLGAHFTTWFLSLARIPVARSTLLVTTSPLFAAHPKEW